MRIDFNNYFKKQYKKLPIKIKERFNERLTLFMDNPVAPELNNHSLHGKYSGCRSINITGDFRALYEVRNARARFINIDTHSNLY